MQFSIKRDLLLKSLNLTQGVIEKKNTLPILSNVLLEAKDSKLIIVATDLDLVFYDEINDIKIEKEGSTTTSAYILFDILRKISQNSDVNFFLKDKNKLDVKANKANFNLLCLPIDNFPNFSNNFDSTEIKMNKDKLLSLINKTKISISNDDTRHYLNGIFLHTTKLSDKSFITGVATDGHRLSSSSVEIKSSENVSPLILPRKTAFQLSNLLQEYQGEVVLQTSENKIQFKIGKTKIISKVIDGKFPDYKKVVPSSNDKSLMSSKKDFINSVERVITVSIDKKEGVKLKINKDSINLSVHSTNSGDGNENIPAKFNGAETTISFNSKYLIDIASQIEDENIKMLIKDSISPVLIEDLTDKNSYYVIMPMKI